MTGAICISLLQFPRCRIQPFPQFQPTCSLSYNFNLLRPFFGACSKFKSLESDNIDPFQGSIKSTQVLRPRSIGSVHRSRDVAKSEPGIVRHELDGKVQASTSVGSSVLSCFRNIELRDAKRQLLERQDSKQLVNLFVFDIETTGFCKESGRIIEIAVRDLSGGENSCFHTLVNPEQHVPNSHIHGITTNMVNRPDVPRMKDLIPILLYYIRSRQQIAGSVALFIAHNARCFDVPFLVEEFSRCSKNIPPDWRFLDTLPHGRQWMKSHGSRQFSLQALSEHYGIRSVGAAHRAMSDVNLLVDILERLTVDMKLTVGDFLEHSFSAPDPIDLMKAKKKSLVKAKR